MLLKLESPSADSVYSVILLYTTRITIIPRILACCSHRFLARRTYSSMMQKTGYTLTAEQLALQEERKAKKRRAAETTTSRVANNTLLNDHIQLLPRQWLPFPPSEGDEVQRVKVMTWNLLAQSLVRRELFPTSNCLKTGEREPMLHKEISNRSADILCLQEVDRLDKLLPVLESAGYAHHYVSGPGKKHGCLIAFRSSQYLPIHKKSVFYDDEPVRKGSDARGSSFRTKNIGSILALQSKQIPEQGFVVATTHLFWHPKYTYERARQAGILLREVVKFRDAISQPGWPCILAGDFNFSPDDPAYSLIMGDPILPEQDERLDFSRVVHVSIDPSVPNTTKAPSDEEGANAGGEEAEVDPDRVITNARRAVMEDNLLSTQELGALFAEIGVNVKSAYDAGLRQTTVPTFGSRVIIPPGRHGSSEPAYSCYTHYWKLVLDYIYIIDPCGTTSSIEGLLQPLSAEDMEPGLPQKGVCGSDHVSLCAEVFWNRI